MVKCSMRKSKEEIKLVRDWLKFANENLTFARSGMDEDYPPYHTICYLCQGSSEKYLKAFLIWNESEYHILFFYWLNFVFPL